MSARLYPLRRTRSYKSDRHLALDEHAAMHGYRGDDFPEPFMAPAPKRRAAHRTPWPVRWPFTVALVATAMLWVLAR